MECFVSVSIETILYIFKFYTIVEVKNVYWRFGL